MNSTIIQNLLPSAWALLCIIAAAAPAGAVVPQPVGFELTLSCNARVLDAIGEAYFMDVWKEEACDNPHLRVRNRNKPALMLTNNMDSVAPITSFTLTINEGPYVFGAGDFAIDGFTDLVKNTMYSDAGVTIIGSSLSDDGKTLTVNFDGLDQGKKAIFCVDIDPDGDGFPYPDYRNVLFGAPVASGGATTDPASYAVTFTGPGSAPNTNRLVGDFDVMTAPPTYQNATIRPYIQMDPIEITTVGGQIPEPAGAMLALVGAAALAAARRRA
ncbi:MAG: hypothetical protein DCC67_08910 [Planctomycetota bacterium]|nr:MAG: hypothetical protein DCC67_08910 [Planctomycetota bacterium]